MDIPSNPKFVVFDHSMDEVHVYQSMEQVKDEWECRELNERECRIFALGNEWQLDFEVTAKELER